MSDTIREALDWVDDFIARCNDDDRGACSAVNTLRAALSLQPAPVAVPEPDQLPTDAMLDDMRRRGLSIDGNNAYKRDLIDCITGTLMLGKQGSTPPPAGHWTRQFWEMARAEGEIQESLAAASPAAPAPRNNHGVDAHYFHRKLSLVLRDFESLTPDELARTLARLSKVADEKVLAEREFAPAPAAQEPAVSLPSDVRTLLEELQWQHRDYDDYYHKPAGHYCPDCGAAQGKGHLDCCEIARVLAPPAAEQPDTVPVPRALQADDRVPDDFRNQATGYRAGWNDCLAALLAKKGV